MNSKTKIIVLRAKKLMYTGIFIALGILFLILLFIMLSPKNKDDENEENPSPAEEESLPTAYIPGIYTTSLTIGGQPLDVEVVVNADSIVDVRLVNLGEAVTTMYPLLEPTFDSLAAQICEKQSTDEISFSEDNRYTTLVLLDAVNRSLEKAVISYDLEDYD